MGYPNFPVEALILPFNGANGSTTFTDYSGYAQVPVVSGNVQISTAQSKFGGSSAFFDGDGDCLTFTHPDAYQLSVDFTIEAWVWISDFGVNRYLFSSFINSTQGPDLQWMATTGVMRLVDSSGAVRVTDSVGTPAATWVHIALCRSQGIIRLFKNGVSIGSYTPSYAYNMPVLYIGANSQSLGAGTGSKFKGYINDFCVSRRAKYPVDFTPPPSALSTTPEIITVAPRLITTATQAASAGVTNVTPKFLTLSVFTNDVHHSGSGRIVGTVKEVGTPFDLAVIRRVRLHRKADGMLVRETWSAADGSYAFNSIIRGQQYYVVAFDHNGNYDAVIEDSIVPESMP